MADTNAPILDLYAPLNHKAPMGSGSGPKIKPATWVPKEHQRRLIAYQILDAYCKNNAAHYRTEAEERKGLREYGDPDNLVEAILSALIGDSQVLSVDDAEAYDPDFDPTDKSQRQIERQEVAEVAAGRQDLLDQWGEDESLLIKIPQAERKGVKLGDASVYVLDWSPDKRRPKLRTYDPSFYFPVFDDWSDEFPRKIHLAWEIEDSRNSNIRKVRRITYELKEIQPVDSETGWPEGVFLDPVTGMASMQLPWNPVAQPARNGEPAKPARPATMLCYRSDGIWTIDVTKEKVDDFDESKARWNLTEDGQEIRNLLLNIDFLPVVHVPNTEEDEEHFGASALLRVAQLLDDVMQDDTDVVNTAANSAFPTIGFEGGEGPDLNDAGTPVGGWGPGSWIHNPNGKINVLSTADALDPLSKLNDRLLERLSVNARVPQQALGRKTDNPQETGIHLLLSYGPMRSMISQMRLGRRTKYRLLLKFVQRFFQLDGQIPEGPENILGAEVVFGAFLPTDVDGEIERIIKLFEAKLLSRRTALGQLQELGVPIDDADEELSRIEKEDFEGALAMLEATGSEQAVAERLGVTAGVPTVITPPEPPEF